MRYCTMLLLMGLVLACVACDREPAEGAAAPSIAPVDHDQSDQPDPVDDTEAPAESASVLSGITMAGLDGQPVDLAAFDGQVVLLVNVASRCGHTPQYAGLQELHERFADQGLVVVGVPSNDFGGQEPGTAEEIATFCQTNYGVTFTMLDKVHVKGDDKVELYQRLTDAANDPTDGGEVKWNFEKFIVDRTGRVAARFRSKVQPESDELIAAIEQALALN